MPGQIVSWVRNEKIRFQRPRAGALAASFWGASQGNDPPQSEKEIFRALADDLRTFLTQGGYEGYVAAARPLITHPANIGEPPAPAALRF